MAGGRFDESVGAIRPGIYINVQSTKVNSVKSGKKGIVTMPLIGHDYGPSGEFITIHDTAPNAECAKLGYNVDDTSNGNMLLIREAFKNCATVKVYIPSSGNKASGSGGGLTATAKYGGTRGNKLAFAIIANPVEGYDIKVTLDGETMDEYIGISDVAEAEKINNSYVDFKSTNEESVLSAIAGVALEGGTNADTKNEDITAFLEKIEGVKFNTLSFPSTDSSLCAAAVSKIKYLQNEVGKTVVGVVANFDADFEGVINVTNGVIVDGIELTAAQATAWVAGAYAGASLKESNTYKVYEGATGINGVKTHAEAKIAIKNGEYFFSLSENGEVVVEYDINSLVSYEAEGKDESYRKNKIIRVINAFIERLYEEFRPGKFPNYDKGWDSMEGIGGAILKEFEDEEVIKNVDYENDFLVNRELSVNDKTYLNIGIQPIDNSEKLFFTIATR